MFLQANPVNCKHKQIMYVKKLLQKIIKCEIKKNILDSLSL